VLVNHMDILSAYPILGFSRYSSTWEINDAV